MPSNISLIKSDVVNLKLFLFFISFFNNPKKDNIVEILCNPSTNSHFPSVSSATNIGGIGIPNKIDSINLVFCSSLHRYAL